MFAKLTGYIDTLKPESLILNVGGVGYLVFCTKPAYERLTQKGAKEEATLFIETHVREDHIHLFGFDSEDEKIWFQTLCLVQGVGPKMALALLGIGAISDLKGALEQEDEDLFCRAAGVGKKLAARLVTELKSKAEKLPPLGYIQRAEDPSQSKAAPKLLTDALSALENLGYGRLLAHQTLLEILHQTQELPQLNTLITQALRHLSSPRN